ncbi:MAG: hypothetical protein KJ893_00765 [Candidatus Omnitrophica bacterium]|nr:hypothetical protein [Candidatus Omnitrophota bacterium]
MGKSFKKYFSRILILAAAVTLFFVVPLFSFSAITSFLRTHRETVEREVSGYLHQKISIGALRYRPPFSLVLERVKIAGDESRLDLPPFFVKEIKLGISLPELIFKRSIVAKKIHFVRPEIDVFEYPLFLKENIEGFITLINLLAGGGSLNLSFDDAALIIQRRGSISRSVRTTSSIIIGPGKRVRSTGAISIEENGGRGLWRRERIIPLSIQYRFLGTVISDAFIIEDLLFEHENLSAYFTGRLEKSVLRLKGFSTLEGLGSRARAATGSSPRLMETIKSFLAYRRIPQKINLSREGFNIFDIDCLLVFSSKKVNAEYLRFNLNNIPVLISGGVSFLDKTSVNARLATFPDQEPLLREQNPAKFDAKITADIKNNRVNADISLDFLKITERKVSKQKIEAVFKDISFGTTPDGRLKLLAVELFLAYSIDGTAYRFSLKQFDAACRFFDRQTRFVTIVSRLFDGTAQGYIAMNTAASPWETECGLQVEGVSANELDIVLLSLCGMYRKLPAKLQGRVFGEFACNLRYLNFPYPVLRGDITIKDGYLDNVRFFLWLSDFFSLPALKRIDFSRISSRFKVTDKEAVVEEMHLTAPEIALDGALRIKVNDFISGKLSLTLPQELLGTSPKFQLLLGLIDKNISSLVFNFQFSGLPHSLNFKWQESEFKQKIKKMLPGFIERGLERKIERAISIISEKEGL